jgi:DNA-binding NarL/FixJ family response regulator
MNLVQYREGRHQNRLPNPNLTPKEIETLKLFYFDFGTIAEKRFVSKKTLVTQSNSILKKLNAHSKTQAVIIALKRGIIKLDDLLM